MRLLLDTQLLLRMTGLPGRLSSMARSMLIDDANEILFSAVNIWEVAIKRARNHPDFRTEPDFLRYQLRGRGFGELDLTSEHVVGVRNLPLIHRDPFDRVLIAQAAAEGITLLTADSTLVRYPGDIMLV